MFEARTVARDRHRLGLLQFAVLPRVGDFAPFLFSTSADESAWNIVNFMERISLF
jgi:hypothetical protein